MSVTSRPPDGLTSIIVPCFNQREYTRHCLRALAKYTRPPWELIVVDNGSEDGTAAYIEGVGDVASFPTTLIANSTNRGFPAAVNQGIAASKGDYVVLLNNDAVVTDGWLDQLIALAESSPSIGMTGPMSNYASPPQLVAETPYRDLMEMHAFADRWRDSHRGEWFEAEKLSGFCLLIKRSVIDSVGGLDERYGLGLFDDDDLARRARAAGFQLCVTNDLFVHHFGSRTFVGEAIDTEALLAENETRFSEKWGLTSVEGQRVSLTPWTTGTVGKGREGKP